MKIISVSPYNFVKVDLCLQNRLTLIRGDSATGKTLMVNTLDSVNKLGSRSDYFVFKDYLSLQSLGTALPKDTVIIMDELEFLPESITDEIQLWIASHRDDYYFVIMDRLNLILPFGPENVAYMTKKYKDDITYLGIRYAKDWSEAL